MTKVTQQVGGHLSQCTVSQPHTKELFPWHQEEATLGWMEDFPPSIEFSDQTNPDTWLMWKVPKRTKNTVKPVITSGPKLEKIRYKTNSGYRLNVLI